MDVRIGVVQTVKEIEIELASDVDRKDIRKRVDEALADDDNVLWLEDRHGAEFAVPSSKVAYVQLGRSEGERRIGFGS